MGQTKQARSRVTVHCPNCDAALRVAVYTVSHSLQHKHCQCGADWVVHVKPMRAGSLVVRFCETEDEAFTSLTKA